MAEFQRDKSDWLRKLSPDEWIRAALAEVHRAEQAYARGDGRAGAAGVKRAAGMALNGALLVEPNEAWGRTYVEHVTALAADGREPALVRTAARTVADAGVGLSGDIVKLRVRREDTVVLEAAKDVIAHAWTVVKRHERFDA